jgi:hypothetical protein
MIPTIPHTYWPATLRSNHPNPAAALGGSCRKGVLGQLSITYLRGSGGPGRVSLANLLAKLPSGRKSSVLENFLDETIGARTHARLHTPAEEDDTEGFE